MRTVVAALAGVCDHPLVLIGRSAERSRILMLLNAALSGRSGALALVGEAGIGKSALLQDGVATAQRDGIAVIRTTGTSGAALAGEALADLIGPLADRLSQLPGPQASALQGVLALDHDAVAAGAQPDPQGFATAAATLRLLGTAAEDGPLLVVVDDVQWIDAASGRVLQFVISRLAAEGIAVLLAARDTEAIWPGVEVLPVEGLGRDDAAALLRHVANPGVANPGVANPGVANPGVANPGVVPLDQQVIDLPAGLVASLVDRAAGNPLVLREALAALPSAVLSGDAPLTHVPVAGRLADAWAPRIDALTPATHQMLAVVAFAVPPTTAVLAHAARHLGHDLQALGPAEAAGLITIDDGGVAFGHPLMRETVMARTDGPTRRAAHGALATATSGTRCLLHRAAAAIGPDDALATELAGAAGRLAAGVGADTSVELLRRAAALGSDALRCAEWLLDAAGAAMRCGDHAAVTELTDRAAAVAPSVNPARLVALRAQVAIIAGDLTQGVADLIACADQIAATAPEAAGHLLLQAQIVDVTRGRVPQSLDLAERARALLTGTAAAPLADATLAGSLVLSGDTQRARDLLDGSAGLPLRIGDPQGFGALIAMVHARMLTGDIDTATALLDAAIAEVRAAAAPGGLPYALAFRAQIDFHRGHWVAARAMASDAVALAEATGQPVIGAIACYVGAMIDAGVGDVEDCVAKLARMRIVADRASARALLIMGTSIEGFMWLGVGDMDAAAGKIDAAWRDLVDDGMREPAAVPWAFDLVDALVASRRIEQARAHADAVTAHIAPSTSPTAEVIRTRNTALLADAQHRDEAFSAAAAAARRARFPFEVARVHLRWGERLRRDRQHLRAREELRRALQGFQSVGATSWVARTAAELRAAGDAVEVAAEGELAALTPQELQVALVVAGGATNRQVASSLFLSPKTVEHHLSRIYAKLGLRSRTDLAVLVHARS